MSKLTFTEDKAQTVLTYKDSNARIVWVFQSRDDAFEFAILLSRNFGLPF
jgi:hypothetical protein